jgi:hypothetical protein
MELTPEDLLKLILTGNDEAKIRICRQALEASTAASKCLVENHVIEIDNLKRYVVELSMALLEVVDGKVPDPVLLQSARHAASSLLPT